MYKNYTFLALIVARGGSKRLKNKNLYPLLGKPLIQYTFDAAKGSKYLDRIILSSEDSQIINFMKQLGCEVPFIRPQHLAQDDTPTIDVALHALKKIDKQYDYLILLQPTSPLRTTKDIDDAIEFCIDNHAKSVTSVVEVDKPPKWIYLLDNKKQLIQMTNFLCLIDKNISANQSQFKLYIPNGAIYIVNTTWILQNKTFIKDSETLAFVMDKHKSVDIDDIYDLLFCELILKNYSFK